MSEPMTLAFATAANPPTPPCRPPCSGRAAWRGSPCARGGRAVADRRAPPGRLVAGADAADAAARAGRGRAPQHRRRHDRRRPVPDRRSRSAPGAAAIVTSQAAERIYRRSAGLAEVDIRARRWRGDGSARLAAAGDDRLRPLGAVAARSSPTSTPEATLLAARGGGARPDRDGRAARRHRADRRLADPPRRPAGLRRHDTA